MQKRYETNRYVIVYKYFQKYLFVKEDYAHPLMDPGLWPATQPDSSILQKWNKYETNIKQISKKYKTNMKPIHGRIQGYGGSPGQAHTNRLFHFMNIKLVLNKF